MEHWLQNASLPGLANEETSAPAAAGSQYTRTRRQIVNAACSECRTRKMKCDGVRPRCRRCIHKGVTQCTYDVPAGETRYRSLKSKNVSLANDLETMNDFLVSLHTYSSTDAQNMLEGLRSSPNALQYIRSFRQREKSFGPGTGLPFTFTKSPITSPNSVPHAIESDDRVSRVPSAAHGTRSSSRSDAHSPSLVESLRQDCDRLMLTGKGTSAPDRSQSTSATSLPDGVNAYDADVLRRLTSIFSLQSSRLFQVFSPEQIDAQFDVLSASNKADQRTAAACSICSVAAVGSQYLREEIGVETENGIYSTAKMFLEDVVAFDDLMAAKCCSLLGMFNVMRKEKVALSFIELGLSLLRRLGPHGQSRPCGVSRNEWADRRKVWRVLLFFHSWLSATLGYVSSLEWLTMKTDLQQLEPDADAPFEEVVQAEMAKVATLKFEMLRTSSTFKEGLSMSAIKTITHDLQQWHHGLPQQMHLVNVEQDSTISTGIRRTIYFTHLLYSGALILLARQVVQQSNKEARQTSTNLHGQQAHSFLNKAIAAARQSAEILRRLLAEQGVFPRCWLCIFQSYSSCLLLLFNISQYLLQGVAIENIKLDLGEVEKCLDTLKFCSSTDGAAAKFYDIVQPYYEKFRTITDSQGAIFDMCAKFALEDMAVELAEMVGRPFGIPGQPTSSIFYLWKPYQQRAEWSEVPGIRSLNERIECLDSMGYHAVDGARNDGMINDLISGLRPGSFLDGFESASWDNGYARLVGMDGKICARS